MVVRSLHSPRNWKSVLHKRYSARLTFSQEDKQRILHCSGWLVGVLSFPVAVQACAVVDVRHECGAATVCPAACLANDAWQYNLYNCRPGRTIA